MTGLHPLLAHPAIWRGDQLGSVQTPSLPSGFAALDAELPGNGWPTASLTEIFPAHEGIGELRILGPALGRLSTGKRCQAWIAPPYIPYAPALQAAGIDLSRLLIIRTQSLRETLWAVEQTLRDNNCAAVLVWLDKLTYTELRRLQLAAAGSCALAVLFRPLSAAAAPSPAALRMSLHSMRGQLAVRILKRRGASLERPIELHPAAVLPKRNPVVRNHAVDRAAFPAAAAGIMSAGVGV